MEAILEKKETTGKGTSENQSVNGSGKIDFTIPLDEALLAHKNEDDTLTPEGLKIAVAYYKRDPKDIPINPEYCSKYKRDN